MFGIKRWNTFKRQTNHELNRAVFSPHSSLAISTDGYYCTTSWHLLNRGVGTRINGCNSWKDVLTEARFFGGFGDKWCLFMRICSLLHLRSSFTNFNSLKRQRKMLQKDSVDYVNLLLTREPIELQRFTSQTVSYIWAIVVVHTAFRGTVRSVCVYIWPTTAYLVEIPPPPIHAVSTAWNQKLGTLFYK